MDEKIAKLYQNLKNEGVDDIRANDIIQKVKEYYEYLSNYNLEQLDYIGALKAIQYGRFLKSNNAGGDNAKVWNDTKVYSDNDVVIWKPRNYQESSIIGSPQWCISFRDYHWNDHVIHNGETIYMIYNGWANEDLQYTSACVERNGNIIIYDSNHNKLNDIDKESFLKSLGDGISVLKPQINVENKQYNTNRNMNKKLIRLTESDLHRIVKESVEKILMESDPDLYDALARPDGKLDMSNPYTWAKSPKMLKDMGYDENGMKRGKKYYDHLLNPNWRFNKRSAGTNFALNEPMGDQKDIRADIANMEKRQNDADARWQSAADTRPLHRKGSLNREF